MDQWESTVATEELHLDTIPRLPCRGSSLPQGSLTKTIKLKLAFLSCCRCPVYCTTNSERITILALLYQKAHNSDSLPLQEFCHFSEVWTLSSVKAGQERYNSNRIKGTPFYLSSINLNILKITSKIMSNEIAAIWFRDLSLISSHNIILHYPNFLSYFLSSPF